MRNRNSNNVAERTHAEGPVARAIEEQTAKIPSDVFLWAAGGAVAASLLLHLTGKKQAGNFVGQWVPTILVAGVYNKLVKLQGHDKNDAGDDGQTATE